MIDQLKWCEDNEHDFYTCGTGVAVCENCGLTKDEAKEVYSLIVENEALREYALSLMTNSYRRMSREERKLILESELIALLKGNDNG